VLTYAAAAEQRQTHPLAHAILAAAQARQLPLPAIDEAHYHVGYGIQVRLPPSALRRRPSSVNGHQFAGPVRNVGLGTAEADLLIHVGSERFMAQAGIAVPADIQALQAACDAQGHALVLVAVDERLAGAIELQPTVRPEAKTVVDALHARRLTLYIISGDQPEPTRRLAQELGIEHHFAQVLPEQKARFVEQLQRQGRKVCFVGDGINDAIALKQAQVSISLRGATSVATDTAQVVLMDQSLQRLPALFDLAHELDRNLTASLWLVTAPACVVIGGVFLFHVGVPLAVAAYSGSFAASVANAMRPLLRQKPDRGQ
jgi:P-type E1-E2 ATPase